MLSVHLTRRRGHTPKRDQPGETQASATGLRVVAIFEASKGVLVLLVGLGILNSFIIDYRQSRDTGGNAGIVGYLVYFRVNGKLREP